MDLSNQPPSDMSMSGSDAADPNAPGVVRYTYTCGTDPEKTIEMKRVLFGPTYWCSISKASFFLNVKDDRIPTEFEIATPQGYHGPGQYNIIAQATTGTGFAWCSWQTMKIINGNCLALKSPRVGNCCNDQAAQAKGISCTISVTQHTLQRVSGDYNCLVQTDQYTPQAPFSCPTPMAASIKGSFDFGPNDC